MIKKVFRTTMIFTLFFGLLGCRNGKNPATWDDNKLNQWFDKGEWLNGWNVQPDNSIDKKTLAVYYYKNKERWDRTFSFLKNSNLSTLPAGRHNIDGDNLYASISEYLTRDESEAGFEAHRKYADIQYVIRGKEIIQITPLAMRDSVIQEYDETRDIEFFTVKENKSLNATPQKFFIFFPSDAHKPGLKTDAPDSVKKVVVKLRLN
ncbi:MAG: YhcH/YjgK/YiaL family protein [Bacteroidales bacterium]